MLKFLFYIALGGVAAFYIAKWAGYNNLASIENDVRGAGKAISRTAGSVSDTVGDAADDAGNAVKDETK